ncbi:hypothetical protein BKA64DRAFT_744422 [Cadophora sp. MPI-SDFR-AT-0126]|nr:hypothetical protein BKA64DRAFT_744422 [Leotiomycetes sp. MPI-SDFR-AT-0126]
MPPFSWTKMFEETGLSADNKTVLSAAADEAFALHLVDLGSVKLNHTRNRGKMAEAIKDIVKRCKCLQDLPVATQEIAADHLRRRATQWKGHLEQEKPPSKPPSKSQKPSPAIQGLTTDLPPGSSSSSSEPASPRPAQPQPQPQPRHPTQGNRKPSDHTSVSTRSRTYAAKEKDIQSVVDPNSAALGPTKNTIPPPESTSATQRSTNNITPSSPTPASAARASTKNPTPSPISVSAARASAKNTTPSPTSVSATPTPADHTTHSPTSVSTRRSLKYSIEATTSTPGTQLPLLGSGRSGTLVSPPTYANPKPNALNFLDAVTF